MQSRWLLTCMALGIVLLTVVAAVEGFTKWTVLLAALLLVCPLLGVWVMRRSRSQAWRDDTHGHPR